MSIQTSKTLTLSPQMNALEVMVQGQQDALNEMQKTKEMFAEYVSESHETIASQAEEIQQLKAQVLQLEAAKKNQQQVEQSLQRRVNELICEKGEHLNKIAYLDRGIDVLNREVADHKERRSQYYDIIGGLRGWRGFSRDAALHKCKTFGF